MNTLKYAFLFSALIGSGAALALPYTGKVLAMCEGDNSRLVIYSSESVTVQNGTTTFSNYDRKTGTWEVQGTTTAKCTLQAEEIHSLHPVEK